MEIGEVGRLGDAQFLHCPARAMCALRGVCALPGEKSCAALYPTMLTLAPGEELWADERFEQRAFFIQAGVLSCAANPQDGSDAPAALYGRGDTFGLAELYAGRDVSGTYHMRALMETRVCSMPAKALRHRLEDAHQPLAQRIMSAAFMNVSCAQYFQCRVLSKMKAEDRVLMLLGRIAQLAGRDGSRLEKVCLGQGDLAHLAGSDRVCVGRALHKLADAGLIALGYKSIELLEPFFANPHPEIAMLDGFRSACSSQT